jgi:peptidoglycan/LPS O-acetylase OafA/YrhL
MNGTSSARVPYPARYASLDAWRGVACLSVLLHHILLPANDPFWLGVQLFFVVSGYCIAAAADRAVQVDMPPLEFLWRRARRIYPPYIASVGLALAVDVAVGLGHGRPVLGGGAEAGVLDRPWWAYLGNATLTQWVWTTRDFLAGRMLATPLDNHVYFANVYWSLGYEEQFYFFFFLFVAVASAGRRWLFFGAITLGTVLAELQRPGIVTGLLIDYWLQFLCGIVVHYRLCKATTVDRARVIDVGAVVAIAIVAANAAVRGELAPRGDRLQLFGQLTVTSVFALVLVLLRRFDDGIARSWPGRLLGAVGGFSYSLYLCQLQLIFAFRFLRAPLAERTGRVASDVAIAALAIGGSWVFHRAFERPFINKTPRQRNNDQCLVPSA